MTEPFMEERGTDAENERWDELHYNAEPPLQLDTAFCVPEAVAVARPEGDSNAEYPSQ